MEPLNVYLQELKKFIGHEAVCRYNDGDRVLELKGVVKGISFNYLHVVIMTDTEKILIKNFIQLRRQRKVNNG